MPRKTVPRKKKSQPSSSAPMSAPVEDQGSNYDHDAAVARYLAERGGEGQVGDVPVFVIPRPPLRRTFGRKHV